MPSRDPLPMRHLGTLCLLAVLLASCAPAAVLPTPTATATPSPLPTRTQTPSATPTPRTPPVLPAAYRNDALTPYGTPHTYIPDTCQYLLDKWSSANSVPGTVVMAIMFHSITDGTITNANQTSTYSFHQLMNKLHDQGFQAITTAQLADFTESNARIPERSVLLVVDDRRNPLYFTKLFQEYWTKYQWPVVNAWISLYGENDPYLAGNVSLSEQGWVDYQAHGFIHNIPIGSDSTDEYILGELQKPIDLFKTSFHKIPIAVVWPGGGFTQHAVQVARQLGYHLGFTTNPRGPVMFNWVPLADSYNPQQPTWSADGPVDDPLMVLPRYWDTDAIKHIPEVLQIGQEATAYAAENKATEMDYYDIVCASHYGPIP